MAEYNHTSSIDYINNLTFDYVETYSFQRGDGYEDRKRDNWREHQRLTVMKDKARSMTEFEKNRLLELDELSKFEYIINSKGQFHPSSTKTHTFKSIDPQINELKNILRTEIKDMFDFMCSPIYRDAIVFYNKSKQIVSTLNICLSCDYMATEMYSYIDGDNKTYDLLRQYFIALGHNIEGE